MLREKERERIGGPVVYGTSWESRELLTPVGRVEELSN